MRRGPVLIIPGWANSGPQHWQTLWEHAHSEYRRVEQRDWETPERADWITTLDVAIRATPSPPILVGLKGAETQSHRQGVLVNHTAETIAKLDTSLAALRRCRHWSTCRVGRREGQCSMRPMAIVMIRENGKDPLQMLVV